MLTAEEARQMSEDEELVSDDLMETVESRTKAAIKCGKRVTSISLSGEETKATWALRKKLKELGYEATANVGLNSNNFVKWSW